mgnify:FL=1
MNQLCPCGSKNTFDKCCLPFHNKTSLLQTPEQLMRSRYSAYAVKNGTYIFDTYAKEKQAANAIEDIQNWANETKWVSLKIIEKSRVDNGSADLPTVTFCAKYLIKSTLFQMTEKSRFIKEDERWKYLDGDIINHDKLGKVKANEPCPCESRKKFKKCCG